MIAPDFGHPDPALLPELLAALPAFVSKDQSRPALEAPAVRTVRGELWTIATNGQVLLAVRGDFPPAEGSHAGFPGTESLERAIPVLPTEHLPSLELRDLKAFLGIEPAAGPPCDRCGGERFVECPDCEGFGSEDCECDCGHQHEKNCGHCRGDGETGCPTCAPGERRKSTRTAYTDPFDLGVSRFNKNVVRPVIRALPDATVRVFQTEAERTTVLAGEGWFALLMPIRVEPGTYPDAPRFELTAPAEVR